jgi:predicted GIY-YIG superfamily endonuclease
MGSARAADTFGALRQFCVCVVACKSRVLYVGVMNHPERRIAQHRPTRGSAAAIARGKGGKTPTTCEKLALICDTNPKWTDLAAKWFASESKRR